MLNPKGLGLAMGLLVGLLAVPVAVAQESEDEQQARIHFEAGRLHYAKGRFEEAGREFRQAYELSGNSALLYNMFLAYRDADRLPQAVEALASYLEEVPDQSNRAGLEARLRTMRARLERQQAAAEAGVPEADRVVDEADEDPSPVDASLSDVDADEAGGGVPTGAWVTMAAGGAMVLGAVITGVMAKGAESDLHDACPGLTGCDPALQSTRDRARRLGLVTDVLWITGAVAAVGGLLWLLLGRGSDEKPTPDVAIGCGPGGCSLAYERSF
jgi:tetratricopeptide (TPR) repeat protein